MSYHHSTPQEKSLHGQPQPQWFNGSSGGNIPPGTPQIFSPSSAHHHHHVPTTTTPTGALDEDYSNEPPLLEELGIHFDHIWMKTQSVLIPTKPITEHILDDTDLAGPLVFCFIFGCCLLLSAKVHFGYIYGFGVIGCVFLFFLMNLLSPARSIDIYRVCSVLGYCLLPIIVLAACNIVLSIRTLGYFGFFFASTCVLWSTHTATRFFEKALHMSDQKYLIAYPVGLVYSCFVLITVF